MSAPFEKPNAAASKRRKRRTKALLSLAFSTFVLFQFASTEELHSQSAEDTHHAWSQEALIKASRVLSNALDTGEPHPALLLEQLRQAIEEVAKDNVAGKQLGNLEVKPTVRRLKMARAIHENNRELFDEILGELESLWATPKPWERDWSNPFVAYGEFCQQAIASRRFEMAMTCADELVKRVPSHRGARKLRAVIMILKGDYQEAGQCLAELLSKDVVAFGYVYKHPAVMEAGNSSSPPHGASDFWGSPWQLSTVPMYQQAYLHGYAGEKIVQNSRFDVTFDLPEVEVWLDHVLRSAAVIDFPMAEPRETPADESEGEDAFDVRDGWEYLRLRLELQRILKQETPDPEIAKTSLDELKSFLKPKGAHGTWLYRYLEARVLLLGDDHEATQSVMRELRTNMVRNPYSRGGSTQSHNRNGLTGSFVAFRDLGFEYLLSLPFESVSEAIDEIYTRRSNVCPLKDLYIVHYFKLLEERAPERLQAAIDEIGLENPIGITLLLGWKYRKQPENFDAALRRLYAILQLESAYIGNRFVAPAHHDESRESYLASILSIERYGNDNATISFAQWNIGVFDHYGAPNFDFEVAREEAAREALEVGDVDQLKEQMKRWKAEYQDRKEELDRFLALAVAQGKEFGAYASLGREVQSAELAISGWHALNNALTEDDQVISEAPTLSESARIVRPEVLVDKLLQAESTEEFKLAIKDTIAKIPSDCTLLVSEVFTATLALAASECIEDWDEVAQARIQKLAAKLKQAAVPMGPYALDQLLKQAGRFDALFNRKKDSAKGSSKRSHEIVPEETEKKRNKKEDKGEDKEAGNDKGAPNEVEEGEQPEKPAGEKEPGEESADPPSDRPEESASSIAPEAESGAGDGTKTDESDGEPAPSFSIDLSGIVGRAVALLYESELYRLNGEKNHYISYSQSSPRQVFGFPERFLDHIPKSHPQYRLLMQRIANSQNSALAEFGNYLNWQNLNSVAWARHLAGTNPQSVIAMSQLGQVLGYTFPQDRPERRINSTFTSWAIVDLSKIAAPTDTLAWGYRDAGDLERALETEQYGLDLVPGNEEYEWVVRHFKELIRLRDAKPEDSTSGAADEEDAPESGDNGHPEPSESKPESSAGNPNNDPETPASER